MTDRELLVAVPLHHDISAYPFIRLSLSKAQAPFVGFKVWGQAFHLQFAGEVGEMSVALIRKAVILAKTVDKRNQGHPQDFKMVMTMISGDRVVQQKDLIEWQPAINYTLAASAKVLALVGGMDASS